jgi:DNA-binding transcriptional LysR family regulator
LRGQIEPVAIVPRLASNNASAVRGAALAGLGIALLPLFVVADDVRNGHLVRVLDGFEPKPQMLCVDYPEGRIPSAKTRLFVEFLSGGLARDGV